MRNNKKIPSEGGLTSKTLLNSTIFYLSCLLPEDQNCVKFPKQSNLPSLSFKYRKKNYANKVDLINPLWRNKQKIPSIFSTCRTLKTQKMNKRKVWSRTKHGCSNSKRNEHKYSIHNILMKYGSNSQKWKEENQSRSSFPPLNRQPKRKKRKWV